jgi:hypothetical protein
VSLRRVLLLLRDPVEVKMVTLGRRLLSTSAPLEPEMAISVRHLLAIVTVENVTSSRMVGKVEEAKTI